jgi:hypothetical protein
MRAWIWTPDRNLLLSDMWAKGTTLQDIAVRLGTTRSAVMARAWRLGLERRPGCHPCRIWTADDDTMLSDMWAQGAATRDIAALFATTRVAITSRAKRLGFAARAPRSVEERFESMYIPEPNSGCWLWIGSTSRSGYGKMLQCEKLRPATHIALELSGRPLPKGMIACHHCDVPACVNPAHLFHGTQSGNIQDCIGKGRFVIPPVNFKGRDRPKLQCCNGHALEGKNLRIDKHGVRICKACKRERIAAKRAAMRGLALAATP